MLNKEALVGIIESEEECAGLIRTVLEGAGFKTASILLPVIKGNPASFEDFLNEFDPSVLIIDVPALYNENWQHTKSLISDPKMQGRKVILITDDNHWRERLVEMTTGLELIPKPFDDINDLIKAVIKTLPFSPS